MLKLTRLKGERIIITHEKSGDEITIDVLKISRSWKVQLGVSAPTTFLIDREEIHEAKKAEGKI